MTLRIILNYVKIEKLIKNLKLREILNFMKIKLFKNLKKIKNKNFEKS
jgi:hypothetical protein